MNIVIVGGGKVGVALATQLAREEHDIVLVDSSRKVVQELGEALDIKVLYGNGASLEVLREAETPESDLLIAATPQDELNMLCCLLARKLGCTNTIARVRNPEYNRQMYYLKEDLGLSMAMNPEAAAAREIFLLIQIPGFLRRDSFANDRVEIVELIVRAGGGLDGLELKNIGRQIKTRVLICALQRGDSVFIPDGATRLHAGDKIYVTAPTTELTGILKAVGLRRKKSKNVLIIGGSRIAQYLTAMLTRAGVRVKLVEKDAERSLHLAELLPKAEIVQADGSEQGVLLSENIREMDAVVTLTNIDEENLIISMYANYLGVPQVITKINRTEYNAVFRDKGIDCVISPKLLCAQEVIRYVRAMQNTTGSSVVTVHHLVDGQVEALEFNVTEGTRMLGVPLAQVQLKPNLLLASISRKGRIIIPGGNDCLEIGDTVVVVSTNDRIILDLNDIFQEEQQA